MHIILLHLNYYTIIMIIHTVTIQTMVPVTTTQLVASTPTMRISLWLWRRMLMTMAFLSVTSRYTYIHCYSSLFDSMHACYACTCGCRWIPGGTLKALTVVWKTGLPNLMFSPMELRAWWTKLDGELWPITDGGKENVIFTVYTCMPHV